MVSPTLGEEETPLPLLQPGSTPAGKQLCEKGSEDYGGHQVEHKPSMHSCGKGVQQYPGPMEVIIPLYSCESTPVSEPPNLYSPVQEGYGHGE